MTTGPFYHARVAFQILMPRSRPMSMAQLFAYNVLFADISAHLVRREL
jgi:hypothetical protein